MHRLITKRTKAAGVPEKASKQTISPRLARCAICEAPTYVKHDCQIPLCWLHKDGDHLCPPSVVRERLAELAKACVNQLMVEFGERGWGDFVSHESEGGK